jgi:hypothetical protein
MKDGWKDGFGFSASWFLTFVAFGFLPFWFLCIVLQLL